MRRAFSLSAALLLSTGMLFLSATSPGAADVSQVPYDIRVFATLFDSSEEKRSVDPGKYNAERVEEVRLPRGRDKASYRLPYPEGGPRAKGYYRIDVFDEGVPDLPDMIGRPEATPWQRVRRTPQEGALIGDLGDAELWTRAITGETETLIRMLRGKVLLELVVRNASKDEAESEAKTRFRLFYDNAVANQLFEEEDYWKWLVTFGDLCEKNQGEINTIIKELAQLAGERKSSYRQWQNLIQIENEAWPADGEGGWYTLWFPVRRDQGGVPALSPTLNLAKMKAARDRVVSQIRQVEAKQRNAVAESEALMERIVASVQRMRDKVRNDAASTLSPEVKKDLEETLGYWQDQRALLKVRLFDAAQWYGEAELPKLIADLQLNTNAEPEIVQLMQAKILVARAEDLERRVWLQRISPAYSPATAQDPTEAAARAARMEAVSLLHQLAAAFPKNKEARAMLLAQEFIVLNWIAGKLEREKQASLAAFERFLTARGYNATDSSGWWDGFKETAWIIWSHPLSTAGHWLAGTPDGLADVTIDTQTKVAANHVSLLVIKRLSKRGLLLKEIRTVAPAELQKHMELVTDKERTPIAPERAHRLCQDMLETFGELADLRALAAGDSGGFFAEFNKSYYDVFDPERSWTEALGDFFLSPSMLLGMVGPRLYPMWRNPATGGWQYFVSAEGKYLALGDLVSRSPRLAALGQRLAQSPLGGLSRAMARDLDFVNKLGKIEWATRVVGARAAAAVVLYAGLAQIGDDYNIPGLRALVTVIFELGAQQLIYEFLSSSGAPAERLVQQMGRLNDDVARQSQELADQTSRLNEVRKLTEQISNATSDAERAAARNALGASELVKEGTQTIKLAPARGLNRPADYLYMLQEFAREVRKGNMAEARRILQPAKVKLERMQKAIGDFKEELRVVLDILRGRQPITRAFPSTALQTMASEVPAEFFQKTEMYARGSAGELLKQGDLLIREGKFDEALKLYTKGARRADLHGDAELTKLLDDRRAFASAAQAQDVVQAAKRGVAPPEHLPRISEGITNQVREGVEQSGSFVAARGDIYFTVQFDGVKYFFKRHLGRTAEEIAENNLTECVATRLGQALDLPLPSVRPAKLGFLRDAAGNAVPLTEGILNRFVDGQPVTQLSQAELLAFKKQLAELRAFRAWIGDPDGHFGNFLLSKEGFLHGIDFGNAQFNNTQVNKLVRGATGGVGERAYVNEVLGHVKSAAERFPDHKSYGGANRFDEFLAFSDMDKFVKRIEDLCRNEGELRRLVAEGHGLVGSSAAGKIDEAVEVLKERALLLRRTLEFHFVPVPRPGGGAPPRTLNLTRAAVAPLRRAA
jgi:hypothetical protein